MTLPRSSFSSGSMLMLNRRDDQIGLEPADAQILGGAEQLQPAGEGEDSLFQTFEYLLRKRARG